MVSGGAAAAGSRTAGGALTLPGLADGDVRAGLRLSDAVAHVVLEIQRRDLHDVVLVAQSWGGYPVTGAAHLVSDRGWSSSLR